MWKTKIFKTREAMIKFMEKHPENQYVEIFVNNAYGVEYKKLRVIG